MSVEHIDLDPQRPRQPLELGVHFLRSKALALLVSFVGHLLKMGANLRNLFVD
jgi:hypothetical protein